MLKILMRASQCCHIAASSSEVCIPNLSVFLDFASHMLFHNTAKSSYSLHTKCY